MEANDPRCSILKLSGAVQEQDGLLRIRNRVYGQVFDAAWIAANLPDAELRRQKEAYRRGVRRTLSVAGAILGVFLLLTGFAFQQSLVARRNAEKANTALTEAQVQRDKAEYTSYVSAMNLAQSSYEDNNLGRTLDLLEEAKSSKYRGFEWGYWNRLCRLELSTLKLPISSFFFAQFSPDGKWIATGGEDQKINLRDRLTGKKVLTLKGTSRVCHTGFIFTGWATHCFK